MMKPDWAFSGRGIWPSGVQLLVATGWNVPRAVVSCALSLLVFRWWFFFFRSLPLSCAPRTLPPPQVFTVNGLRPHSKWLSEWRAKKSVCAAIRTNGHYGEVHTHTRRPACIHSPYLRVIIRRVFIWMEVASIAIPDASGAFVKIHLFKNVSNIALLKHLVTLTSGKIFFQYL